MHEKEGLTMAFRDQVKKFEGRNVKVETVDGTFFGRLVEVKSSTITLRENNGNNRTIIRNSKIVAVTEHDGDC
jgi:ribosome maturation factor RimP